MFFDKTIFQTNTKFNSFIIIQRLPSKMIRILSFFGKHKTPKEISPGKYNAILIFDQCLRYDTNTTVMTLHESVHSLERVDF